MGSFDRQKATTRPSVLGRWSVLLTAVLATAGIGLSLLLTVHPAYADDPSFASRRTYGTGNDTTTSVALGDVNGDGWLDLVVGSDGGQDVVYLNDAQGKGLFYNGPLDCSRTEVVRCFGSAPSHTKSIALGDINGDGKLDIVAGNAGEQSAAYLNDGTGTFASGPLDCDAATAIVHCFGTATGTTQSVALARVNSDNLLDIVAGNGGAGGQQSAIYLSDNGTFQHGPIDCASAFVRCFGAATDDTTAVALGFVRGFVGLVAGKNGQPSAIYLLDSTGAVLLEVPFGAASDGTTSIALGDVNRDGVPEIVAGNAGAASVLYSIKSLIPPVLNAFSLPLKDESGNALLATRSVAFGDVKSNGYLDLVMGNDGPNIAYLSNFPDLTSELPAYARPTFDKAARSVVLGDIDGDGDLDLVIGKFGQSVIYLNNGPGRLAQSGPQVQTFGGATDPTSSVAVADVNGDGALDLVVGNNGHQSQVYLNNAGSFSEARPFGGATDPTTSVAVADVNGDNALDVVVGNNGRQSQVYLNNAGSFSESRPFGGATDPTSSVAVADVNGDGALDIIAGNLGQQSAVYLNDGAGNFGPARVFGNASGTHSIAVGDIDRDGDLDIVTGNAVYLNDGSGNFSFARSYGDGTDATSVAVGDVSGDGVLDIVAGNRFYINSGTGSFALGFVTCGVTAGVRCLSIDATSVALGDIDGDGDLDIAVGSAEQNVYYLNDGQGNFLASSINCGFSAGAHCFGSDAEATDSVALGDLNGDGYLDLVIGNVGRQSKVFLNGLTAAPGPTTTLPQVSVTRPGPTQNGAFFSTPIMLSDRVIPISYRLRSATNTGVGFVRASYSLNGGGTWLPAIAATGTITTDLTTSSGGITYTYNWDTFASGVFGQSDNVVFRIEAYPSSRPSDSRIAGPYQRPYLAAQTFPFRVRGTQVQVYRETAALGNQAANALVYRLPAGATGDATPLASDTGQPFRTDSRGYLQGRGEVQPGDRLVALLPISSTDTYTIYLTSALPISTGLQMASVTTPGLQTLVVSQANPLMLLNLSVSLEWDARYDQQFVARLRSDLQRTSEALYDWSNGQVALGQITIYYDHQHWDDANIRIYASNRVRPNAAQGGIVSRLVADDALRASHPLSPTVVYEPGQIHIGAIWNRYGESGGNLSEDWPRTLAHELGHYALYLNDNYIGLNTQGLLVPRMGCKGAMTDPYRDDYTEFHPDSAWSTECAQTLSNQTTGRSDWATIKAFYPQLNTPTTSFELMNQGPTNLPLAVTAIQSVTPVTPTQALDVPIFYLKKNGAIYQPGINVRAFLFRNDRLIDLGRPTLDQLTARGARPGDRLCVYELDAELQGCEKVSSSNEQLALVAKPGWQPELTILPVTSTTIDLGVANVPAGLTLKARLYPINDASPSPTITLALEPGTGNYRGTFALEDVAPEGFVHVWVEEAEPRREIVTDYALGGAPGYKRGFGGYKRGFGGYKRGFGAPVASSDGQVILFGKDIAFKAGEFFAFQAATYIPQIPSWATVVGQAYQVTTSPNAPSLANTSISFTYLGNEVPAGDEEGLRVYFWNGSVWRLLPTSLDTYNNNAAAPTQGPGLYALMSSVEVPIRNPGWNLFAYPVRATRSVAEALHSIDGFYSTVYGYDGNDATDPWKVYDTTAPAWVNDLGTLEYGQGYWIHTTEAITVLLKGNTPPTQTLALARVADSIPNPPATYYGAVQAGSGFVPTAGMTVQALVNGVECGSGQTLLVNGQVVYSVKVRAVDGSAPNCGAPGRSVTFTVDGRSVAPTVAWDNSQVREVDLRLPVIYLPVVVR